MYILHYQNLIGNNISIGCHFFTAYSELKVDHCHDPIQWNCINELNTRLILLNMMFLRMLVPESFMTKLHE